MRTIFLLAGVAALTAAIPTAADAQGRGNGRGPSVRAEQQTRVNVDRGRARADARTQARIEAQRRAQRDRSRVIVDRNGDGIDDRTDVRFVDRDRNGVDDRMQNGFIDRDRNGVDDRAQNRYGGAACPPGLANRTPACVPPGQAKRMFREGQRIPTNFNNLFTNYSDIPVELRNRFNIPSGYNYIYRDNQVYVVDPRTRLVRSIIDLIF